jgi:hypothetical protein
MHVDRLRAVAERDFDNRIFESQCESGHTFNSEVCFPCAMDAKLIDSGHKLVGHELKSKV